MECQVKDVTVYYEEVGSGRPLFALHGWPLDHRHILNDLEPLFVNREGWRRIYPDLPGMGKTRAADWITHEDHILDIVLQFIDTVALEERFVVAGASYGGYLARGVVYRKGAQIDGMFLNVPVVETDETKVELPQHEVIKEDAEFLADLGPDEQDMRDFIVVQSPELLQEFRQWISPAVALADRAFLERLEKNYSFSFNVDPLPEPFPAPSLILTGRHDNWCGYRDAYKILENYPRATYVVLDRAGHALPFEQKALFRALASEWLDRIEEYTLMNTGQEL
jgi:pimeloyl-ACP methyl ester carboxylesterase